MEEQKVRKKNNIGVIITIVLLVIIILGLVGFICYDKGIIFSKEKVDVTEKEEVEEKVEEKEELLDIYSDQVQTLYNNVHNEDCGLEVRNFYETNKISLESFKSIAYSLSLRKLREKKGTDDFRKLKTYTYDEINNIAKKIFGKDFSIEEKQYEGCPVYKYNATTKTYILDEELGCGCGTTGPEGPNYNMYKATKIGNEIHIYESVVYSKYIEDGNSYYTKYYKDSARTIELSNHCYDTGLLNKTCIDQSTKYEYIYTLEDDNYIITDIKKIS